MSPTTLQWIALACTSSAFLLAVVMWTRRPREEAAAPSHSLLRPLAAAMIPSSPAELEALRAVLAGAGLRHRDAPALFAERRIVAIFAGLVVAIFLLASVGGVVGSVLACAAIAAGGMGPRRYVQMVADRRREEIALALPSATDLLTTTINAGLSLPDALARVSQWQGESHATLAEELEVTASEMNAGVPVADAFRRLSRRVGLDELSALAGVIAQAHGLGAPIAQTLRDYSETSRRQRMSTLEERAGKLAAQLVLPLALFLLPAALLTVIGPSVLQLIAAFSI